LPTARISLSPNITNLAAGDFNYDGKLDLLVSGKLNDNDQENYLHLYFGDHTTFSKCF
jgi:hypothetical protein